MPDSWLLIWDKEVKTLFRADTKALLAKYWLVIWIHLLKQIFIIKILKFEFFGFYYKLSNFLSIIFGHYIQLYSDWAIWYDLKSVKEFLTNVCYFRFTQQLSWWPCQTIYTINWEVECCTVILILSSNKTIKALTSCSITQIVFQKGI